MKKRYRIISLLLIFVMLVTCLPRSVSAIDVKDDYREGVLERYETYILREVGSMKDLLNSDRYMYSVWMDMLRNKSFPEKAVLWATNKLTDHETDQKAYMDYLTNLLAMLERGNLATLSAQAQQKATAEGVPDLIATGTVTLDTLLEMDLFGSANKGLKAISKGISMIQNGAQSIASVAEVYVYTLCAESYLDKLDFLTAISEHATNNKLKKAADTLIGTINLEFTNQLMQLDPKSVVGNLTDSVDFVTSFMGLEDTGAIWQWVGGCVSALGAKLRDEAFVGGIAEASGVVLPELIQATGTLISVVPTIQVGFAMGGFLGNLIWGSDLERFREIEIMYEVANSLMDAIPDDVGTSLDLSGNSQYEMIRRVVACGEALAFARLRGEACYIESRRDNRLLYKVKEEEEETYNRNYETLQICYAALEQVFPEAEQQVVVSVEHKTTDTEKNGVVVFSGVVDVPKVFLPGKEKVAEMINGDAVLTTAVENSLKICEDQSGVALEYNRTNYKWYYDFVVTDVYSVPGALCYKFSEESYSGGAHPMHWSYTRNYSLENGEPLAFVDVLNTSNPNAKSEAVKIFAAALKKTLPDVTDPEGLITRSMEVRDSATNWFFDRDAVVFEYAPYELAAYAAGYIRAEVPYRDLDGIISDSMMPVNRAGSSTTGYCALLSDDAEILNRNMYGGVTQWGMETNGLIYDLHVGISNGYPSAASIKRYCFYANYATENDIFWLDELNTSDVHVTALFDTWGPGNTKPSAAAVLFYSNGDGFTEEIVTP